MLFPYVFYFFLLSFLKTSSAIWNSVFLCHIFCRLLDKNGRNKKKVEINCKVKRWKRKAWKIKIKEKKIENKDQLKMNES